MRPWSEWRASVAREAHTGVRRGATARPLVGFATNAALRWRKTAARGLC
jgi:hypothetical protein